MARLLPQLVTWPACYQRWRHGPPVTTAGDMARLLPQLVTWPPVTTAGDMARLLPQLVTWPASHSHITQPGNTATSQDQRATCGTAGTPQDIYLWPTYHRKTQAGGPGLWQHVTRRSLTKRVGITRWPAEGHQAVE
jgi:hypothetical protein